MDVAIDIAVIPVAGLGTRLLPATKSQPKEMLPVGRRPVVQYVVEELTQAYQLFDVPVERPGRTIARAKHTVAKPGRRATRRPKT